VRRLSLEVSDQPIIAAKPAQASFESPLCEITYTKDGRNVTFPNKLAACAQLARICGWDSPQKVNVEVGDSLSAFLREIVTK
jgi:hypothetical protein